MAEHENGQNSHSDDQGDRRFIELDVEDVNGVDRIPGKGLMRVLGTILVLVAIVTVLYIASKTVPYDPLKIYGYHTDKTEYCPFEEVTLTQDIELADEWYFTNSTLSAETYMKNKDGRPYGGTYVEVNIPPGDMPRTESASNTIRVAPPIPGEWYAGGDGFIEGKMFWIIPVDADIGEVKSNWYTVKPWNNPECLELRGIDPKYGSSD